MGIAAGVAVALAVLAVSVSSYAGTRSELRGQVDDSLSTLLAQALPGPLGGHGPGAPPGGFNGGGNGVPGQNCEPVGVGDECLGLDSRNGPQFGAATGILTLIYPNGASWVPHGQSQRIPVSSALKTLAASGGGRLYTDVDAGGTQLRVLAEGLGSRGALAIALPLTDVNHTLSHELLLMVIIAAAGIALAALLGLLVARTALSPIARFTRQTEAIAAEPALLESERVDVSGNDELARLGRTFNATLDALEQSVAAQRNLVADASHELRTPIASIRANLQLLRDESRLPEADRAALRQDMIEELDELTALVGDVVELARGSRPGGGIGDVRLDEIVSSVVERTRRRAPEITIEASIEPTLVRGEGDRIARAVTNVLDNARKWSPPSGVIEVKLQGGTLWVRDHGPGFHDEDLPFVFDRFHRARDARGKPGSGLGLAIVRQAAEAHGGFAEAANAPGGGATLRLGFGPAGAPEGLTVADEGHSGDPAIAT
jgi:two-component system, OmpR family, sensor histidine kinase MprB